jgi:hypothetical protein
MAKRMRYNHISFILMSLMLAGCGHDGKVRVKGVVTLDGKPVEEAGVNFIPLGEHPHPAFAMTDKGGYFDMTTNQPGDGVYPGEYKVCVTKKELGQKAQAKLQHAKGFESRAILGGPRIDLLPKAYGDEKRTPLRVTVPTSGSLNLELSSSES